MNLQERVTDSDDENSVAIIGMSGRFPDANNLDQFWDNLRKGVDSVRAISDEELRRSGVDDATISDKDYIKVASMLSDLELFDAAFFGISPREAELIDPQHRLFMECCWEALEHAGYSPRGYEGAIGVYAGVAESAYLFENIATNPRIIESVGMRSIMQVNQKDFLCGRVAYELNLRGPAVVVQTACSTSLVAVHLACQSVLAGECDIALSGGVAISNLSKTGYQYVEGGYRSADGHCRAFDAGATGIVDGSGIGIVVLKRLSEARNDGDTIHAIIRGSAINNDGADKISFTAPSVDRQAAVISEAQAIAGVTADTISYVEAHGTGTMLGDPIEVRALTQAFSASTSKTQFCRLGSIKTNLGHLDTAAGIAGLIKTVLALEHREIPPSLHFEKSNPHIDFENSPFLVNRTLTDWPVSNSPRRAGISSFGVGGTNAHVIVEEADRAAETSAARRSHVLLFSAKTPKALSDATGNFIAFLTAHPETNLADAAYTLAHGREYFRYRRSVSCVDHASAIEGLKMPIAANQFKGFVESDPRVVFMFPGGGTQYVNMARELYESEATFRSVMDECATLMMPILRLDLRTVIFPGDDQVASAKAALDDPQLIVSALFAVEYALAKQLIAWGVQPSAMVGHSLGEYVAACLAGVFSLPDALRIVTERGRLIATLPAANMVAVLLSPDEVQSRLGDGLWLACVNSQRSCTISGTPAATERFAERLATEGIECQLLKGWPGSHSGLMDPIAEEFRKAFADTQLHAPSVPYLSNLTGDWIKDDEATNPDYWVAHLRHTVRFADCARQLLKQPEQIYLEVGPGHTLSNLIKRDVPADQFIATVTSIPRRDAGGSSLTSILQALGQLWSFGCAIDWSEFYSGEARRRIPLPLYPFQRKRYWINPGTRMFGAPAREDGSLNVSTDGEQAGIVAESLPSTKVETGATYTRPDLPTPYVMPQSQTEKTLSAIWESILGVSPIGVHDDFFLLGGSSLVAIQLVSRIRSNFNVDVPLRTLFRVSTVAAQAQEIESTHSEAMPASASQIVPRSEGDVLVPPSFAQERLLFINRLNRAADAAYHISKAIKINGPLDKGVLKAALDRMVSRHESLRTSFADIGGQSIQIIAPADSGFVLRERELSELSAPEQAAAIARINAEEARAPFDLASGPLIRGQLLRLKADESILLVTQHHIISDGWSIGIMVRELSALYGAFSRGESDPLPVLQIQYADYAVWQRGWLQGEVLQAQTEFWKSHLSGAPALLELPTDRPRPAIQSYAGGHVQFELSAGLTAGLRELSQRHGTTLFMTLLSGWAILLGRLSGRQDVVIGTPVANRQRSEIESLIGFFVNTLALRVHLTDDPTVAELLAQVKRTTLSAYEHQDVPFDQVVEALQPPRSMSYSPVFQAMLNVHNTPTDSELVASDLTFSNVDTVENTALCDVLLSIQIRNDVIAADINYVTDLFDAATIERYAGYLHRVLSGMVAQEHRRVSELTLLSEMEERRVLRDFNDTAEAYPQDRLIHELFEEQAALRPEAVAVVYETQELSYRELNERANRLAHELRELGVRPDDRVALCVVRGVEMIVAMLGILKAGGAYVPLDPSYPAERLKYMLSDSAPVAVLTQAALKEGLASVALPVAVPVVVLDGDEDGAQIGARDVSNLDANEIGLNSTHLAYVIYTSGSTGVPKGVMIEHRNTVNFLTWATQAFSAEQLAKTLFSTSINFDLHVFELFAPLSCGAAITLAQDALATGLSSPDVSLINTVPSAIQALLEQNRVPESVRQINLAGEPLQRALVERLFAATNVREVANLYGPSETTTYSTWIGMDRSEGFRPYIGRPIANTQIYLLDRSLQPVPIGVAGEIYIGGAGVARGYLHRAELTAERFIKDPFSQDVAARMYKTGDLGRWRADGNIEFLGRNDFQVKIRGFRIELGEIEARMSQCAGVKDAVVLAREDSPGDKRLVAYLTAREGVELSASELRSDLSGVLAEYMVPSAFVILPSLPLTPNGKLDRKALPAPDQSAVVSREYAAPVGAIESALAGIWQELLHVERVGRHDNFFELGGHSLLAVRVMGRILEECHVEGSIKDLFENPILSQLANRITELQLTSFVDEDMEKMKSELNGLSESELLAIIDRESLDDQYPSVAPELMRQGLENDARD